MTTPGAIWQITIVDETGSTNTDLLSAAASGAPDRSVLMARHQTAGRGRLDRTWIAPAGSNLLVSLLFRRVPEQPHELTRRVALAAVAACRAVAGASPTLKWPNDLLLDGRKLAGVLAQAGGSGPDFVVVGIGVNVRWAPGDAARLGEEYDPVDVLDAMLHAYDDLPADIDGLYRDTLATLGQSVRVEVADSTIEGRALDVLADGRLVVLDECGITHRFDTGDVVHLR
ncbi:MAG TPA: biotin--[acetyl-CoA-carboxylase] ligase [Ilumatobacteraceae bacterium]|nr:biotin--[acetyl-CoA-carboxylase] ligase [Ilumatobacteraceae bacterium]